MREQEIRERFENPYWIENAATCHVEDVQFLLDLLADERRRADSLTLERDATEACRLKDNQYLLAKCDKLKIALSEQAEENEL